MRRITTYDVEGTVVIEVDGELDIVASHDLRQALTAALAAGVAPIELDLSKVNTADDQGIATLSWCSRTAIEARRTLMWSSCSRPLASRIAGWHGATKPRQ